MTQAQAPGGRPAVLPVHSWRSYVTLLSQNQPYRRLWLAGVISQIGNWFNYIAIFVLLTELTGSGHAVSWFLIAKFLPTSLLGPAAGVIADRLPRKLIMITCDLLRIFVVLGFLLVKTPQQVWLVYFLALVQESLWTFYDPARRASVPNLCSIEELNVANALSGATWSLMLAFGSALGGLITAYLGWKTAIILDALSFLTSALMLLGLHLPLVVRPKKQSLALADYLGINDLKEGFGYLRANKRVAAIMAIKSGWALSGGILVMLTIFGEQVLAATDSPGGGSGILYGMRGLGAAVGPLLAWRVFGESEKAMHRAIGAAFFFASISYMLFSQAPNFLWAGILVLLAHLGGSVQWVFSTTLLQKKVPDQFRGRVLATEMMVLTFVLSVSTYLTGVAIDQGVDPRVVMLRLGALFMLPGTLWIGYLVWLRNTK